MVRWYSFCKTFTTASTNDKTAMTYLNQAHVLSEHNGRERNGIQRQGAHAIRPFGQWASSIYHTGRIIGQAFLKADSDWSLCMPTKSAINPESTGALFALHRPQMGTFLNALLFYNFLRFSNRK